MYSETITAGESLILSAKSFNANGVLDISSGYRSVAKVKADYDVLDAGANIDIDSVNEASRFTFSSTGIKVSLIVSSESNALSPGEYVFGWWLIRISDSQEFPLKEGKIIVVDSAVDTKS